MNGMMIVFVFVICMCISSILNILLKTTEKKHWVTSFFVSLALAIIFVMLDR